MDISLERISIDGYRMVYRDSLSYELSSDCVVPDTQDDIQKILNTSAQAMLKTKDASTNTLHIGGELKGELLYLTEDEAGISVLDFSIPFDIDAHTQDAESGCYVSSDIRITALDARCQNPRKVNIRAELEIALCCYRQKEIVIATGQKDGIDKLFCKSKTEKHIYPFFVGEKELYLEEEFEISSGEDSTSLLYVTAVYTPDNAEKVGNKLIVKGHADVSALLYDEGQGIFSKSFSSSFSQLFDIPAECEICYHDIHISPSGQYCTIENGRLMCELNAVIIPICYTETDISYIADAYCCGKAIEAEYKEMQFVCGISNAELSADAKLHFDAETGIDSVLYAHSRLGKTKFTDGKLIAPISTELIYKTENGTVSQAKHRDELSFMLTEDIAEGCIFKLSPCDTSTNITATGIDIAVSGSLTAMHCDQRLRSHLVSMSMADDEPAPLSSTLYICKMGNRSLWDIAKHYGSSEAVIRSVNKLETEDISPDKLLLIPTL